MNKKQAQIERIYSYIKERIESGAGVPSQREMARDCQLSPVTVSHYLTMLEAQGRIKRKAMKSRSIRLVNDDDEPPENELAEGVYTFVKEAIREGEVPSQDEIGRACYLSRAEVRRALLWLEAQGRLELVDGQRNIRLNSG